MTQLKTEIHRKLEQWRADELKLVFTNGCFDLLHPGHVSYLKKAQMLGDKLIVGINSDSSVRILKGSTRPINPLNDRITMLSALSSVDLVIPYSEETPIDLIKAIKPHILVKGGDYKNKNIVGSNFVLERGGIVKTITFEKGYSTSGLINRIKES